MDKLCHKNHMTMCNNTFACTRNVSDNVRVSSAFFIEIMFILKAIKGHMINRILNS